MNSGNFFVSAMRKFFIVMVYFAILAGFLYFPVLKDFLRRDVTLNVYVLPDRISSQAIKIFERHTGVKVNVKFFESDEELYAKFKITGGEGYDVVLASDYTVHPLIKDGMLTKLDHEKIPSMRELNKLLVGKDFDPHNTYSLPLGWLVYGVVFDRKLIVDRDLIDGFELLYANPAELVKKGIVKKSYKIAIPDEPREIFMMTALSLYGRVDGLRDKNLNEIQNLLIKQRAWVESYSLSNMPHFLLSGVVPVALFPTVYLKRISGGATSFEFVVPKQGGLMVLESLAITRTCKIPEQAHQFIDFILSEDIARIHAETYNYYVSNQVAYGYQRELLGPDLTPDDQTLDRLYSISQYVPLEVIEDIWLAVRGS
ncbi:MAG: extracellular solute-binding protein [Epsilonproteobacteria bacterium]|nr:extracellular solute-binding protein [Campylobacterota bacterium]